jgi:primosomal protein N' (replication factor Y) (superfamily II helicase)
MPERMYVIVALEPPRAPEPSHTPGGVGESDADTDPSLGLVLHYHVPDYLEDTLRPGHLVVVPLRGRPAYGVVTEQADSSPVERTKPVTRLVDARPVVSADMLELARWVAGHYRCTLWQALAPMLPPGVARRAVTKYSLSELARTPTRGTQDAKGADRPLLEALGRGRKQVVSMLREGPRRGVTMARLKRGYRGTASGLDSALRGLEREGVVTRTVELPAPRSRPQTERVVRLSAPADEGYSALAASSRRAPLQAAALDWLLKRLPKDGTPVKPENDPEIATDKTPEQGWQRLSDLYLHTGANSATVTALERKGLVELGERPVVRRAVPGRPGGLNTDEPPTLTVAQATAWREIAAAVRKLAPYLRAIGMALRMGRQALVLVPEISLTPQAVHRFASRFPGRVALVHSQLSPGQQFDEWRRIRDGHADIVVGSRSAVFAPLPRLGLVVVDEEHEWAYKQSDHTPRYHARDAALKRAALTGSVAILGSATPDLATFHAAYRGDFRLLSLPYRVGRRRGKDRAELLVELPMPPVQVVDMRAELKAGNTSMFSRALHTALDATLARGEQAILYLNRRGSNSFMLCRECGFVPMCKRCDVPLVYHAAVHGLLCHRCNAYSLTPSECPECGSSSIKGFGTGTQRVVDEVAAHFPRARVLRWDRDTASRRGGHEDLMEMFTRGEADVLVGTQMIAKGLDIPRVTMVGVISADTGLYMPDFRAPERTLQLLVQVAGRAGRRPESAHSRVVVQTYNPDHYAIQAASTHDYLGFYRGEIRFRAEHGYPPYGQLARLVYTSPNDERAEQAANALARHLQHKAEARSADLDVLGPAPCFVHKVRGRYRWQVLLRGDDLTPVLDGLNPGAGWALDVDPMSVL